MIRRRAAFDADVIEQAVWIAGDNARSADRFLCAIEETLRLLETAPRSGRRWESPNVRLAGVRHRAVRQFPNRLLFYRPVADTTGRGIEALRLLHAARDLGRAMVDEP